MVPFFEKYFLCVNYYIFFQFNILFQNTVTQNLWIQMDKCIFFIKKSTLLLNNLLIIHEVVKIFLITFRFILFKPLSKGFMLCCEKSFIMKSNQTF